MKPEKPALPDSLVAMWVFIALSVTAFIGYIGARGDGLNWYVSLPLPAGAVPAWAFGPATVLMSAFATYGVIQARSADGKFNRPVFVLAWLSLGFSSAAELLLFGNRHSWIPAAVTFGIAALICLFVGGTMLARAKAVTAAMMTLLAIWFGWAAIGTLRTYKADRDTVPTATVTDSAATAIPSPAPARGK